MTRYRSEGLLRATPDQLWQLLDAHLDPQALPQIHNTIVSGRLVSQSADEYVVERRIRMRKATPRSTWKITYRRPDFSRWEIVESEGPFRAGGFMENRYTPAEGGTHVKSEGDLSIQGIPAFLTGLILVGAFRRIDREDEEYVKHL